MIRRSTLFLLLPLVWTGCGGSGEFPTAKVTGKVLCEGQPVPNVLVNFAPLGSGQPEVGKMGVGVAQADGTFVVSTYGDKDGAVIGKHAVSVSPPHPEDYPDFNCNCETEGNRNPIQEVEVVAGDGNEFTINMPPKKNKRKSNFDKDTLEDIKASAQGK